MASSWVKQAMVATTSVEVTGMCRRGRREKADCLALAAKDSFGAVKLVRMWDWAWLAEGQ